MWIVEADNTTQFWPNLGSQQSAIVIWPVSPFASVKSWPDDGSLCRMFKFTDLQPQLGPVSALHQADCHFYHGKPFWKWENQSWHSIGPLLSRKPMLAARVWAKIGRQLHAGVIIPATARYWQPIFANIYADAGPVLDRI